MSGMNGGNRIGNDRLLSAVCFARHLDGGGFLQFSQNVLGQQFTTNRRQAGSRKGNYISQLLV